MIKHAGRSADAAKLAPVTLDGVTNRVRFRTGTIVAAMAGLLLGLVGLSMLYPGTTPRREPPGSSPTTTAPASPFDSSAFEKFWASEAVPPSIKDPLRSADWNGIALVAHTKIYPDADAFEPAKKICGALSAFWLTTGDGMFRPVQILDSNHEVRSRRRCHDPEDYDRGNCAICLGLVPVAG